jgi:hypothetical protein
MHYAFAGASAGQIQRQQMCLARGGSEYADAEILGIARIYLDLEMPLSDFTFRRDVVQTDETILQDPLQMHGVCGGFGADDPVGTNPGSICGQLDRTRLEWHSLRAVAIGDVSCVDRNG